MLTDTLAAVVKFVVENTISHRQLQFSVNIKNGYVNRDYIRDFRQ